MRIILKKIKQVLFPSKAKQNEKIKRTFPYQYKEPTYGVSFVINNAVEEFRLKDWGGERSYVIEMMNELNDDDVFYDIGSSVGLNSTIAAMLLKKGRVISFEPDPENLKCLKENFRLNNLTNFEIQQMAVGDKKDKMKLFTAGSNGFSPSLQKVNGIDSFIEVEVNSIDNLISEGKIPVPTVVKIDIEGAEMMALKGMEKLLSGENRPRIIFLEVHPEFLTKFNTSDMEIYNYFSSFKYLVAEKTQRDKQVLCKLVKE